MNTRPPEMQKDRVFRILATIVIFGFLQACSSPEPEAPPVTKSVVLIVVDTLRHDTLGCYGNSRNTSPNIDQLAADGIVFEGCVAQSNWTVPATASMLTSLFPSEHGAEIPGDIRKMTVEKPPNRLPDEVTTLAEILADQGFSTGLFTSNPYLQAGMQQGYEHEVINRIAATALNDHAISWLDEHAADRFFLHLQYIDVHIPIAPPLEFAEFFAEPGDDMTEMAIQTWRYQQGSNASGAEFEDYRRRKLALYDGTMRYVDMEIGRLLDHLEALGIFDDTLVIVTSDHGEEFWEHVEDGYALGGDPRGVYGIGHGHAMYDETIRVPLIFRGPGINTARRLEDPSNLIDLPPTILDALKLGTPSHMRGRSLIPLLFGDSSEAQEPSLTLVESPAYGPNSRALIDGRYKLIVRADGHDLLFDLELDPTEKNNLAETRPKIVARLKTKIETTVASFSRPNDQQQVTIDEATEAELRALGYLE